MTTVVYSTEDNNDLKEEEIHGVFAKYMEEKGTSSKRVSGKLSAQQKILNRRDSCWYFCKRNDLKNLKESKIEYSLGEFGENILHACILYGANDCAMWLIQNHPKLAMEVYEEPEYYGESILHMIIATNNIQLLDFILKPDNRDNNNIIDLNILINKRAIGHFFNPEWGTINYGEYALSFAVVLNQKETVIKLLKNGANINCIDSNGNTIFHYCSKYNLVQMFKHLIDIKTRNECDISDHVFYKLITHRNNDNFTFFQCAASFKQKEIFEAILEWRRIECWSWGPVSFVAYPLNEIDTHGDDKNSVLETILADNAMELIDIPVIQAILNKKWDNYAKVYFYIWCISNVLYVLSLVLLYVSYSDYLDGKKTNAATSKTLIVLIPGGKLFVTIYQTIIEVKYLMNEHGPKRGIDIYFQWNLPGLSIIEFFHILLLISNCMIICVWISIIANDKEFITIFMTLSFITECLYLLFFGQTTELMGRLVISVLKIITGDIVRFLIIWIIILFSFAGAVRFMYTDLDFYEVFITFFHISLGVGDYWDDGSYALDKWQIALSQTIYNAFLLISTVLLLNLLIAIFSETIDEIGQESYKNWLFQRASTILLIERRCDKHCLRNTVYKRTGTIGKAYGFTEKNANLYFIAFNLVNDELEVPKKRPPTDKLDKSLSELKNKPVSYID